MKTFDEYAINETSTIQEAKKVKFTSLDKMMEEIRVAFLTKYAVSSLNDLPPMAKEKYMSKMDKVIGSNIKKLELDLEDI